MQNLLDKLIAYGNSSMYPFHMPGHKRQHTHQALADFPNPFSVDITEVDGFDNLHHPEDILKDSLTWAADIYGSDKTYYLVNGSSSGILSAISGTVSQGGTILMSRNCHKAAYHGVLLRNLNVTYLHPEIVPTVAIQGGINPDDVEAALEQDPTIEAVMIVSPTYDGVVSDVQRIATIAHRFDVPLIVDEAHGAHFAFADDTTPFPTSALQLGADIVIQSVHKTLPSLTQTAVMHLKKGYANVEKVDRFTHIYQSTSPSYVLLASIERCITYMTHEGRDEMQRFSQRLIALRSKLASLQNLHLIATNIKGSSHIYDIDPSKIVISTHGTAMSGAELEQTLRDTYHLEMEMYGATYATAMTSLFDTDEGLARLVKALQEIDAKLSSNTAKTPPALPQTHTRAMTIAAATEAPQTQRRITEAVGDIAAEFVYVYPPGIPIVAPGEVLTEDIVARIMEYKALGLPVQGMQDPNSELIFIVQ